MAVRAESEWAAGDERKALKYVQAAYQAASVASTQQAQQVPHAEHPQAPSSRWFFLSPRPDPLLPCHSVRA